MRITKLQAENFKRLHAIEIEPSGAMVTIGGKNRQGKTSTLDAIEAALGGGRHSPPEPIRRGAKKASIVLDLDTLTVTRTFTKSGSSLKVESKDGTAHSSPQGLLDDLTGRLTFDPLEFSRMKPDQQAEELRKLAGLDFEQHDLDRGNVYDRRTEAARSIKRARSAVEQATRHDDAPDELVSVAELSRELGSARELNSANDDARRRLERLRDKLRERRADVAQLEADLREAREHLVEIEKDGKAQAAKVEALADQDCAPLIAKIDTAEATNEKIRSHQQWAAADRDLKEAVASHRKIDLQISAMDEAKRKAIESASYPIDGLTVDDAGVLLDGLPLEQASGAQQLQCSVAIGLALNPKLKILLIRDGSLLDEDSLADVARMADEAGAQVWIERVGKGDEITVVIEDGSILEPES